MRVLFLFIFYVWLAVEDGLLYVLRTTVPVVRSCRTQYRYSLEHMQYVLLMYPRQQYYCEQYIILVVEGCGTTYSSIRIQYYHITRVLFFSMVGWRKGWLISTGMQCVVFVIVRLQYVLVLCIVYSQYSSTSSLFLFFMVGWRRGWLALRTTYYSTGSTQLQKRSTGQHAGTTCVEGVVVGLRSIARCVEGVAVGLRSGSMYLCI